MGFIYKPLFANEGGSKWCYVKSEWFQMDPKAEITPAGGVGNIMNEKRGTVMKNVLWMASVLLGVVPALLWGCSFDDCHEIDSKVVESSSASDQAVAPREKPSCFQASWVGMPLEDFQRMFGEPMSTEKGAQGLTVLNYAGSDGLAVYFIDGRVAYWIVKPNSTLLTPKNIGIGSHMEAVIEAYGNWDSEQTVSTWFAGEKARTLYHHPEFDKYKLNYPDEGLVFIFDKEKNVELIYGEKKKGSGRLIRHVD